MKKIFILFPVVSLAILLAVSSCKQGNSGSGKNGGIYPEKSGIITYKPMNMMGMTIIQTIYFDDYGNKEARELVTKGEMGGQSIQTRAMDIRDGLINYHFELENITNGQNVAKKEAIKQVVPREMLEEQNLSGLTEAMKKRMKYAEEGTEKVAGLTGTKYTMAPDSTNPTMVFEGVHYKNLPLKMVMGSVEIIAEKVDFNGKIPADKFKVPEGYTVVDHSSNGLSGENPVK